jgi:hypothetical protein
MLLTINCPEWYGQDYLVVMLVVPKLSVNQGRSTGLQKFLQNFEQGKSEGWVCFIVLQPHVIHESALSLTFWRRIFFKC